MINLVQQISDPLTRPWFTDVTLQASGLTLQVSGVARVAGTAHALDAAIEIVPPESGSEDHMLYICDDGTLILDPGVEPSRPLYGQICWFAVPAGCTGLADVTINQLTHVEEAS